MQRSLLVLFFTLLLLPGLSQAGEVYFYHTDNVGSPVAMTDSTGKVVWRAHDLPFGEEFQTSKISTSNSRRFIGKEKDSETGLVYIGARYLDPESGRFLQPDPVGPVNTMTGEVHQELLGNPQRLNRYAYGLNNPYRYVDPDGLSPDDLDDDGDDDVGLYPDNGFDEIRANPLLRSNNPNVVGAGIPGRAKNYLHTKVGGKSAITDGTYTTDPVGMARHKPGTTTNNKSVFKSNVDAEQATLDAARYADKNNLWNAQNKAKVSVNNGTVGYLSDGTPTQTINVYRRKSGDGYLIHGTPGSN